MRSKFRWSAALTAVVVLAPAVARADEGPVGLRFPDWPVNTLVRIVETNPGLRTLYSLDRSLALQSIERLLMPLSYAAGDEARCVAGPPAPGTVLPFGVAGGQVCAVAYVVSVLRDNPALADTVALDPLFAGEMLKLLLETPVSDRQSPLVVSPASPDDPRDVAC